MPESSAPIGAGGGQDAGRADLALSSSIQFLHFDKRPSGRNFTIAIAITKTSTSATTGLITQGSAALGAPHGCAPRPRNSPCRPASPREKIDQEGYAHVCADGVDRDHQAAGEPRERSPESECGAYTRLVEMPEALASAGFSREARTCKPKRVRVSSNQKATITAR